VAASGVNSNLRLEEFGVGLAVETMDSIVCRNHSGMSVMIDIIGLTVTLV
jgi:hypothetical protein